MSELEPSNEPRSGTVDEPSPNMSMREFFEVNSPIPGAIDLLAYPSRNLAAVVAEVTTLLLLISREGKHLFDRVLIVAPPIDRARVADELRLGIARTLKGLGVASPSAANVSSLLARVEVRVVPALTWGSLSAELPTVQTRIAVVVHRAADFRDKELDVPPSQTNEGEAPWTQPGDDWAPHVIRLLGHLAEYVKEQGAYCFLDLGQRMPGRPSYRNSLMAIASAVGGEDADPADLAYHEAAWRWQSLADEGRFADALRDIEGTAYLTAREKLRARLPLLRRIGKPHGIRAVLTEHPDLADDVAAQGRLHLAMLAESAEANDFAARVLERTIDELMEEDDLGNALRVALHLSNDALITRARARLALLFPDALNGVLDRIRTLVASGEYEAALHAFARLPADQRAQLRENETYVRLLHNHAVGEEGAFRRDAFLAAIASQVPSLMTRARLDMARRLVQEGDRLAALISLEEIQQGEEQWPLDAEALWLIRDGRIAGDQALTGAAIRPKLVAILKRAAERPEDIVRRVSIGKTLDATVLGTEGLALLVHTALLLASTVIIADRTEVEHLLDASDILPVIEQAASRTSGLPLYVPGTDRLPFEHLNGVDPESVLYTLHKLASRRVGQMIDTPALNELSLYIAAACSVSPWAPSSTHDILVLRIVALALARHGEVQKSRDIAEITLQVSVGRDLHVRRMAWHSYADVYARLGNGVEALTGAVYMLAIETPRTWPEHWEECMLMARLLREFRFYDEARVFLARAQDAQREGNLPTETAGRVDLILLQLDYIELLGRELHQKAASTFVPAFTELEELLGRAASLLRSALDEDEEIAPSLTLLASLLALAVQWGVPVMGSITSLYEEGLVRVDRDSAALLPLLSEPTPDRIAALARSVERARFSGDIAYDAHRIAHFGRSLLGSSTLSGEAAIYAIECVSDASTFVSSASCSVRLLEDPLAPAAAARALATEGLAVVLLGLRDDDVCRVQVENGQVGGVSYDARPVFDTRRFAEWRTSYPQAYREAESHVFFTSTQSLGLGAIPERAVIVADTRLQVFPPNLWNVREMLTGQQSRLAIAPSLEWLTGARQQPFSGDGRRLAWIPRDLDGSPLDPLSVLFDALAETFDDSRITAATGVHPPPDVAGAELLVVAAHGNLTSDAHYFRAVQSDTTLVLSPAAAARSMGGAGTVVLFVCSGGRISRHLEANTVTGIARLLLDHGCRAVVAPPWPLSVGVPPRWLPTFMASWGSGSAVIDATFDANRELARQRGEQPAATLAMTVYGDPEMRRS